MRCEFSLQAFCAFATIFHVQICVVWTEHTRPYRRETIATRFCDVLIVLMPVSAALVRVRVETQQADVQFGPLFDGAQIHIREVCENRKTI